MAAHACSEHNNNNKKYGGKVVYLSFVIDQLKLSGVRHLDLCPDGDMGINVHPYKIPLVWGKHMISLLRSQIF